MRHATVLMVGLLAVLAGWSSASGGVRFEGVEIDADAKWVSNLSGGYYPVRFVVRNGEAKPRELLVVMTSDDSDDSARRVSRTVEVGPGATSSFAVMWPVIDSNGSVNVSMSVDGKSGMGLSWSFSYRNPDLSGSWSSSSSGSSPSPSAVIIGPRASLAHVQNELTTDADYLHVIEDPRLLPDSWLGYSGVGAVIGDYTRLRGLPQQALASLGQYVAAGGVLVAVGVDRGQVADACEALLGPGPVRTSQWFGGQPFVVVEHGFGRVAFVPSPRSLERNVASHASAIAEATRHVLERSGRDFNARMGYSAANEEPRRGYYYSYSGDGNRGMMQSFKIPGVGEVPVRAFVLVMLAFVIVVGPVNYIVLYRRKKLHWMLVTVPAIALLSTLAVVVYAFVAEGLGIQGRVATVTWLDSGRKQAVTLTRQALYAGISPGSIQVGNDTGVFPVNPGQSRSRDIDWTGGQTLGSGWIPSRTETQWVTLAVEPARQRLQVRREGGNLVVVNGLGADIRWLRLEDEDGRFWAAGTVEDGHAVSLQAMEDLRYPASNPLQETRLSLAGRVSLGKGLFVAEVDAPLFDHGGPEDIDQRQANHAVIGTFEWVMP